MTMNPFTGSRVALLYGDRLIVILRDDKPGIPHPNTWEFPGGGREGSESAKECAFREVREELGIRLGETDIVWENEYPSLFEPGFVVHFYVASIDLPMVRRIKLGTEGQRWALMSIREYLDHPRGIDRMKARLSDYLGSLAERSGSTP